VICDRVICDRDCTPITGSKDHPIDRPITGSPIADFPSPSLIGHERQVSFRK